MSRAHPLAQHPPCSHVADINPQSVPASVRLAHPGYRKSSPQDFFAHLPPIPRFANPPPPSKPPQDSVHHERLLPRALCPPPTMAGQDGHARRQLVRQRCRLQAAWPEVKPRPTKRISLSCPAGATTLVKPSWASCIRYWRRRCRGISKRKGKKKTFTASEPVLTPPGVQIRRSGRGGARDHADCSEAPVSQGVVRPYLPYPSLRPVQLPAQAAPQGPVDQVLRGTIGAGESLVALRHEEGVEHLGANQTTQDTPYLTDIINQVEAELAEKDALDSMTVIKRH